MLVICRNFLLNLALRTQILVKLSHASTLSIWNEENSSRGFLGYEFGGLIFRGAYTWRGLFSEFHSILSSIV